MDLCRARRRRGTVRVWKRQKAGSGIRLVPLEYQDEGRGLRARGWPQEAQRLGESDEPTRIFEADHDPDDGGESSETLVPGDLWKEIAALARGEVPAPRGEAPAPRGERPATRSQSVSPERESEIHEWVAPGQALPQAGPGSEGRERVPTAARRSAQLDAPAPTMTPSGDLQGGYLHPDQALTHEEHAQIAPLERPLPVETPHDFVPHSLEPLSKPRKQPGRTPQRRSLLSGVRSGSKQSLREAIVLAEVLNPPIVLRDSDRQPPGEG